MALALSSVRIPGMGENPAEQPKKKRRWFQFSLRTAVLTTLSVGVLLWPNVHPRQCFSTDGIRIHGDDAVEYGWPLTALDLKPAGYAAENGGHDLFPSIRITHFHWAGFIVDLGVLAMLTLLISFSFEYFANSLRA
jgi:hypothetical protein